MASDTHPARAGRAQLLAGVALAALLALPPAIAAAQAPEAPAAVESAHPPAAAPAHPPAAAPAQPPGAARAQPSDALPVPAAPPSTAAAAPAETGHAIGQALSGTVAETQPLQPTAEFAAALAEASAAAPGGAVDAGALTAAYAAHGWQPLWLEAAALSPRGTALVKVLQDARAEGLEPRAYPLAQIGSWMQQAAPAQLLAADILLSDSAVRYGRDLHVGRTDPKKLSDTYFERRAFDAAGLLAALQAGDAPTVMAALRPQHPDYEPLRQALQAELGAEALPPLPKLETDGSLKPGKKAAAVAGLRERMVRGGWFDATATVHDVAYAGPQRRDPALAGQDMASTVYDDALLAAVQAFQASHELEADGVVGPATLAVMNGGTGERISHILASMERLRWLPDTLPERRVWVNVPAFWLTAFDAGQPVLGMKVIVGSGARKTPIFSDAIQYIEFNPTWTVPPTIARKDFLSELRQDPGYLQRKGIKLYAGGSEISPYSVDWKNVGASSLGKYRMTQPPGKKNPLGQVKFMFPNDFDVYLHDTSTPGKFEETVRLLSSGCVRVGEPWKLTDFLLADNDRYKNGAWEKVRDRGKTARVGLATDVPVYLAYQTVTVDTQGQLAFHGDVYGLDSEMMRVFTKQVVDKEQVSLVQ